MITWHSYIADIRDPETGFIMFPDIECEVEVDAEFDEAIGVEMTITAVRMLTDNGAWIDLMHSRLELHRQLAGYIADVAENDDHLAERVMRLEGIVYVGMGGLDPDGRYRKVRT